VSNKLKNNHVLQLVSREIIRLSMLSPYYLFYFRGISMSLAPIVSSRQNSSIKLSRHYFRTMADVSDIDLMGATQSDGDSAWEEPKERKEAEFLTPPPKQKLSNKPRPDYHPGWTTQHLPAGMVSVTHDASGSTYKVPKTKMSKALFNLDPTTFAFVLNPTKTHCKCSRVCHQHGITVPLILRARRSIYETDQPSLVLFARLLRSYNSHQVLLQDGTIPDEARLVYEFNGKRVCGDFWRTAMGTSGHTKARACRMAKSGKFLVVHGSAGQTRVKLESVGTEASESLKCHSYWTDFFNKSCQRPNDETRLFPTEQTFPAIYAESFLPYAARQKWKEIPGVGLFTKVATSHPDFDDVKKKKKHTHLRCDECADCKDLIYHGFKNGDDLASLKERFQRHNDSVQAWREMENYYTQLAKSSPHEVAVLKFDDTESLGFPHLGRRVRKSMARRHKFEVVPWLMEDVGRQQLSYVYSTKKRYVSRTDLHHICRSLAAQTAAYNLSL
jgi:hypothetical protein